MSLMASFVLSFSPRDVLDEIWDLIESVSEGFPSYSYTQDDTFQHSWLELVLAHHIKSISKVMSKPLPWKLL